MAHKLVIDMLPTVSRSSSMAIGVDSRKSLQTCLQQALNTPIAGAPSAVHSIARDRPRWSAYATTGIGNFLPPRLSHTYFEMIWIASIVRVTGVDVLSDGGLCIGALPWPHAHGLHRCSVRARERPWHPQCGHRPRPVVQEADDVPTPAHAILSLSVRQATGGRAFLLRRSERPP